MVRSSFDLQKLRQILRTCSVVLALGHCGVSQTCAATAGELLQKGIYAEETVGNLEDAIHLYEQAVQQGKEATRAAAEAQFRLGVCLQKQDKHDLAAKAFQTLIDTYPAESDWIAKAQQQLAAPVAFLPVPWKDGDQLTLNLQLANGNPIGTMIYSVERETLNGQPVWRCYTRAFNAMNNGNSFSEVYCDDKSFIPLQSVWMHDLLGEAAATYDANEVKLTTAGKSSATTMALNGNVWDNEQAMQLFRRLPIEVGYKDRLVVLSTLGGGKIPIELEVTEKQTIKAPAGTFECYKLVLSLGQTFWISADEHRYVVQFEAPGVTAQLANIQSLEPSDTDPASRAKSLEIGTVQLSVPGTWYSYVPPKESEQNPFDTAFLLDAAGRITGELKWGEVKSLKAEYRESARAWSEGYAKDMHGRDKSFEPSPEGIQEITIGDTPACTLTAQRTENGRKVTLYGVALMKGEKAMTVRFTIAPANFEKEKATIDQIVNSLRLQ